MSLFSRLFGGGSASTQEVEAETHKGFSITPCPARDGGQYRIQARITKTVDGTDKEHMMIRADTVSDEGTATSISVNKAKQLIDEQGDALFR